MPSLHCGMADDDKKNHSPLLALGMEVSKLKLVVVGPLQRSGNTKSP